MQSETQSYDAIVVGSGIAGGWAWGQVGEDGLVGYLPMVALERA
ncbi:MAG TPA: hypothetical protein PKD92_13315 [Novosphingobium sp.]|nr:hypothetical protein [Novosphingobium sp.]